MSSQRKQQLKILQRLQKVKKKLSKTKKVKLPYYRKLTRHEINANFKNLR